jgi:transcriptional regulator with XRE-family HTH domain
MHHSGRNGYWKFNARETVLIERRLREKSMSLQSLADAIGMDRGSLLRIVQGKNGISTEKVALLKTVLDLSSDAVVETADDPSVRFSTAYAFIQELSQKGVGESELNVLMSSTSKMEAVCTLILAFTSNNPEA